MRPKARRPPGNFATFTSNRSDPHFTVDETTVYQHIEADEAARATQTRPW
uniref:Uncharacterized protein n=1 Tax=Rhizobium rhizogenes TaxID=359 RepID=A0A7S4ZRN1_RHIRH|nr:hypothetical protein [Rhizobium rhizogenes]QCL09434.1 hypothetical protein pC5.7c_567 [Rhizobium rhizogenes]QCL09603.1 hypothetical protein pC5.8a_111 [Rhizobium rhizogenes]